MLQKKELQNGRKTCRDVARGNLQAAPNKHVALLPTEQIAEKFAEVKLICLSNDWLV